MGLLINFPLEVKVCIGSEQGKLPDLTNKEKRASPPGDRLQFPAHAEKPPIQIELQFAKEDFSANTTKQQKLLEKDKPTIFSFLVKPLKAEACILTVVISYAPNTVDAGVVAALILLTIALITHQVQGVENTIALVVGCAANAFGVPIYSGVTSLFNQNQQSNSSPSAKPAEPAMFMKR